MSGESRQAAQLREIPALVSVEMQRGKDSSVADYAGDR
jgi:hypothetical protein